MVTGNFIKVPAKGNLKLLGERRWKDDDYAAPGAGTIDSDLRIFANSAGSSIGFVYTSDVFTPEGVLFSRWEKAL